MLFKELPERTCILIASFQCNPIDSFRRAFKKCSGCLNPLLLQTFEWSVSCRFFEIPYPLPAPDTHL